MNIKKIALCTATFIYSAILCNNTKTLTSTDDILRLAEKTTKKLELQYLIIEYYSLNHKIIIQQHKTEKMLNSFQSPEAKAQAKKRFKEVKNEEKARLEREIEPEMKKLIALEIATNGYLAIHDCMKKRASFSKNDMCECTTEWETLLNSTNEHEYAHAYSKEALQTGVDTVKKKVKEIAKHL